MARCRGLECDRFGISFPATWELKCRRALRGVNRINTASGWNNVSSSSPICLVRVLGVLFWDRFEPKAGDRGSKKVRRNE